MSIKVIFADKKAVDSHELQGVGMDEVKNCHELLPKGCLWQARGKDVKNLDGF